MPLVPVDSAVVELALLDIVDVTLEGEARLNAEFLAACRAAFAADPRRMDEIVPAIVLARALARGLAQGLDVEALTLAALEIGSSAVEA